MKQCSRPGCAGLIPEKGGKTPATCGPICKSLDHLQTFLRKLYAHNPNEDTLVELYALNEAEQAWTDFMALRVEHWRKRNGKS